MKFSLSSDLAHQNIFFKLSTQGITIQTDDELLAGLKTLPEEMDFNIPDGDYNTILFLAAANNRIKTLTYLLTERKVDPNVKVTENSTAAHIAARFGHTEVLKALINCKEIKLLKRDKYGETALIKAIGNAPENKVLECAKLLIAAAPGLVSIPNEDNVMPIEYALNRQLASVINLLIDNKAEITESCSARAVEMMLSNSVPDKIGSNGVMLFKSGPENSNLKTCCKLIIEAEMDQKTSNIPT